MGSKLSIIFHIFLLLSVSFLSSQIIKSRPLKEPPPALLDSFTINGTIPLEYYYVDDTNNGEPTHYIFSNDSIQSYMTGALKMHSKISSMKNRIQSFPDVLNNNIDIYEVLTNIFPKENWFQISTIKHLSKFANREGNSSAIVFGSMDPWLETWLLHLGVRFILTVEYNKLTYDHESIKTISVSEFDSLLNTNTTDSYLQHSFDFAFSQSSFDHDGLGRYGDPLNANGDILAMEKCLKVLKKSTGMLFLSVPIGPDVIVWNLHRRYGRTRLPLLLEGWDRIGTLGWNEDKLDKAADWRKTYEPVLVLRPKTTIDINAHQDEDIDSNDEMNCELAVDI